MVDSLKYLTPVAYDVLACILLCSLTVVWERKGLRKRERVKGRKGLRRKERGKGRKGLIVGASIVVYLSLVFYCMCMFP